MDENLDENNTIECIDEINLPETQPSGSSAEDNSSQLEQTAIKRNPEILKDIFKFVPQSITEFSLDEPCTLKNLTDDSDNYETIKNGVINGMRMPCTVENISEVKNAFLLASFYIKMEQKKINSSDPSIKRYYHGTTVGNALWICKTNFNWRKTSKHLFGHGISFSPSSKYASFYPKPDTYKRERTMLYVDVMVQGTCTGTASMKVPTKGTDTSLKPGGQVVVKYDDSEYYPAYVIKYKKEKQAKDVFYGDDDDYYDIFNLSDSDDGF